jgi:transcriptional regulator with XRE-family HTH domain
MDIRDNRRHMRAEEWEARLGTEIRDLRLSRNVTQAELARRANIDRTTVARMEHGNGGSIKSLIQIARALGREEWLEAFVPPAPIVSPMQLLRDRQRDEARKRVRARQTSTPRR